MKKYTRKVYSVERGREIVEEMVELAPHQAVNAGALEHKAVINGFITNTDKSIRQILPRGDGIYWSGDELQKMRLAMVRRSKTKQNGSEAVLG